ncbi:hypothetical protein [Bacillus marinisedimentorum]|nr:hypothetical protein [Bacillus marinisedimentorum]
MLRWIGYAIGGIVHEDGLTQKKLQANCRNQISSLHEKDTYKEA